MELMSSETQELSEDDREAFTECLREGVEFSAKRTP